MAITATAYNNGKKNLLNGTIDLDTDTIKVALTTSSYTPNIDTHEFFDDITNQVEGTGYTAGGATLANAAVTADTTNDRGVFDADDVVWSTSTITARYAIIYKDTETASTSESLHCNDRR
jgi:hypothetical protein